MDAARDVRSLAQTDIFRGFDPELIREVFSASTVRQLDPGEVLITQGVPNQILFLLLEGRLEVVLSKDGTRISIPIQAGKCLGEMSLIMEQPTSAMARAVEPSRVLLIPGEVLWEKIAMTRQGVRNLMNLMAQRLQRTNYALIRKVEEQLKYELLENELKTAGKIQSNMVPDGTRLFPNRPQVDAFGLINQARIVGGDFFDALALDPDHIYFAIGDVSGKGMPAALLMARVITSLRLTVGDNPSFENVFPTVNALLARNNQDLMFVSAFGGILNVKTGLLRFSNAGHNPPFASLKGSGYRPLALPMGTLLGVFEESLYEPAEIQLQPGDSLVLYTDGVTEAIRPDKEMFGEMRTCECLDQSNTRLMKDLVAGLESRVTRFVGGAPQNDDLTILALRYLG